MFFPNNGHRLLNLADPEAFENGRIVPDMLQKTVEIVFSPHLDKINGSAVIQYDSAKITVSVKLPCGILQRYPE